MRAGRFLRQLLPLIVESLACNFGDNYGASITTGDFIDTFSAKAVVAGVCTLQRFLSLVGAVESGISTRAGSANEAFSLLLLSRHLNVLVPALLRLTQYRFVFSLNCSSIHASLNKILPFLVLLLE